MFILVWCVLLYASAMAGPSTLVNETYDAGHYLFDPTPQNWTDASKVCRAYNGHLAFPKTQEEADALWSIMTRYKVKQVHAGFHDQFIEGEYYTAKGRLINETSFNTWSVGAPIGGSSRNCGGLKGDGLVDVACKDILPSICEENEPSGNVGFLDYEFIAGHSYYKYYQLSYSWPYAMRRCYDEGSHLLILNSEEEQTSVFSTFNLTDPLAEVWVGVHHLHADRVFFTIFDETLDSTGYNKWEPGEPKGSNAYYPYVAVKASGLLIINSVNYFICEYNPSK